MSRRHLASLDEIERAKDEIVKAVVDDQFYRLFARDVTSGRIVWNPETDVFALRERATEEHVAESVEAMARLMKRLDEERTGSTSP